VDVKGIFINNHGIPAGGRTKKSFTNFNGYDSGLK